MVSGVPTCFHQCNWNEWRTWSHWRTRDRKRTSFPWNSLLVISWAFKMIFRTALYQAYLCLFELQVFKLQYIYILYTVYDAVQWSSLIYDVHWCSSDIAWYHQISLDMIGPVGLTVLQRAVCLLECSAGWMRLDFVGLTLFVFSCMNDINVQKRTLRGLQ